MLDRLVEPAMSQQADGMRRRIGWLIGATENDLTGQAGKAALQGALAKLGWIEGRNLRIDLRWSDDPNRMDVHAKELVGLGPDVIITYSGAATRVAHQQTQTIPIVFTAAGDPVASGLLRNIARPEGNITGFSVAEPSLAGKRLGFLKEAAPRVARVAIIFNPELLAAYNVFQARYIRKRPMCRSQPQTLSPAEPVPIGSNPLGAGRR